MPNMEKLETVKGYNRICIVQSADFHQALHFKCKIGHEEMKATFFPSHMIIIEV